MEPLPQIPGYELLQPLGGGVLTHVFTARRWDDDRRCAVKVLRDAWSDHPTAVKLLRREARALITVRHPQIVALLDAHVTRAPYFLALELLDGESLRERLQREYSLNFRTALWIARQTADGLSALHRAGFIHGDIKPENVRLVETGYAVIVDLGFAHPPGSNADLGVDGIVLGSANYLAPELCHDRPADDFTADWYSFGVTVLEMLSGRTVESGHKPLDLLAESEAGRPNRLTSLLEGLLAPLPEERPLGPFVLHELIALEIAALGLRRAA